MKRLEFTLSMPGRASWDGRWSGEDRAYLLYKMVPDAVAKRLLGPDGKSYWSHRWSDGWRAGIDARVMKPGERRKKSAGFCGYDWMVSNILSHGSPYASAPAPEEARDG